VSNMFRKYVRVLSICKQNLIIRRIYMASSKDQGLV
jgi:hypothetical protein